MGALDPDLLDLVVLDLKVLALADLVAAADVLLLDRLAGLGVDLLLLETVSGLLVDPVERDPLRARRGRIKGDGAGNQGQFQIALPVGPGRHGNAPDANGHFRGGPAPAWKAGIYSNFWRLSIEVIEP